VTFANVTLSPTSATVRAILVLDDYRFWIGTSGGVVYYTINGGETFFAQTLPGGTLTVIDDIVAATDEVIHISRAPARPPGG
jgi:ligand-binding sensor domain-containing protein